MARLFGNPTFIPSQRLSAWDLRHRPSEFAMLDFEQ